MTESIQIQLKKGVLEMCVLALLSKGDNYAYDIASRMAEAVGMGEGTVYPLMRRMQNDGLVSTYLVESASGPSRKYYKITRSGAAALKAQQRRLGRLRSGRSQNSGRCRMTRADFLYLLRRGLEGLPQNQIKDLVADCESHFTEGMAAGRSEEEIAAALGDPSRLARELRAEAGFKRWEAEGTPRSFAGVVLALLGLATVDVMVLFPFLCTLGAIFLAFGAVALALFIAGVVILMISPFPGLAGLGLAGGLTDCPGTGACRPRPGGRRRRRRRAVLVGGRSHRAAAGALRTPAFPSHRFRFRLREIGHEQICGGWIFRYRDLCRLPDAARWRSAARRCRAAISILADGTGRVATLRVPASPPAVIVAWDGSDTVKIGINANVQYRPGSGDDMQVTGDPAVISHVRVKDGNIRLDCRGSYPGERLEITLPGRHLRQVRNRRCRAPHPERSRSTRI